MFPEMKKNEMADVPKRSTEAIQYSKILLYGGILSRNTSNEELIVGLIAQSVFWPMAQRTLKQDEYFTQLSSEDT